MSGDEESDDGADWNSGPWCKHHWRDPSDCDECAVMCRCGHAMREHAAGEAGRADECEVCDCQVFDPAG